MSRFATLAAAVLASVLVGPASAEAPLPPSLVAATMRPAVPLRGVEDLVATAALHASAPPAARTSSLAARAAAGPKVIARVDISDQTMTVVVDGVVRHRWKVSTAGKGYRTPVGVWQPTRMHTMWRSRKYDNAPMPHSIFFTGGYAIHATPHIRKLGRPASHGCVRLHPDHARELFALTKAAGRAATRVVIQR